MKRTVLGLTAALLLIAPGAAQAGKPYVLGNSNTGDPTVTAGDGVFHVVWNDEDSGVFHYCRVLPKQGGCSSDLALAFNDAPDGGRTGVPGKAWIVPGYDNRTIYLVHAQYVSGDTYVWTSTNGGQTFGSQPVKVWGGVNGTVGTDSRRPLLVPGTQTIAFPTVNTGLFVYDAAIDGSDAASEQKADLDQTGLGNRSYDLDLATIKGGGTLATSDDLSKVSAWVEPDGAIFGTSAAAWGKPRFVANGSDATMNGAFGENYLAYTARSGGKRRFEIRKWAGTAFGKPTVLDTEPGAQARVTVADDGDAGAVWRGARGLQLATSSNGGKSWRRTQITSSDEVYSDLEVARSSDGTGLAVWRRKGAIAAADLTAVADPSTPARSTTGTKNQVTLGLNVPGTCVKPGKTYGVSTGGQGKGKVAKVRYRFGGQSQTDAAKPWGATFQVQASAKPGSVVPISAKHRVQTKSKAFNFTLFSDVTVCG
ncbi:hypothetical protein AB0L40_25580 [Patulibacter sp. NPDC049589]|uniref:hypothetical protein n=1 Tax=Patulibacter sp. NPDC049589 TaxID=3154731 RepID=UPI003419745E